jgi:phosphatidylglycerophosphate synthase
MFKYIKGCYKYVRYASPLGPWYKNTFVGHFISTRISPFFRMLFLKLNVKPNTITLLMIFSGWIGAFLFMVNNIYIKLLGYIFIHLWFIFDCSDGEVARITKNFSKMGKELDYVAHIVNHPMFQLAFLIASYQLYVKKDGISLVLIVILFFLVIILNLIGRGLMWLMLIYEYKLKDEKKEMKFNYKKKYKILLNYLLKMICQYPNIAIFFPLFYFIDYFLDTKIALYYMFLVLIVTFLVVTRMIFNTIKLFYKA